MIQRVLTYAYIRALEKYLDLPSITQTTDTSKEFLANAWRHSGYREYAKQRNEMLIYQASGGSGLDLIDRTEYAKYLGQRMENLHFAALAKKCFELEEQKKKQKK